MLTTVFGAEGFVGAAIRDALISRGRPAIAPAPGEIPDSPMGTVIYATSHVANYGWANTSTQIHDPLFLTALLWSRRYTQFIYISSADVYLHQPSRAREVTNISVNTARLNESTLLSLLSDEAACLHIAKASKVVRLSRVYSDDGSEGGMLGKMISDALTTKRISLPFTADSGFDFLSIQNAVGAILHMVESTEHRCYNVGSGFNTQLADLSDCLRRLTGGLLQPSPAAPSHCPPPMSIDRAQTEFGFVGTNLVRDLPMIVRDRLHRTHTDAA